MWTQLAIATVSTTTGATAEGAVMGSPTQPPRPTATITESATTSMIANVPPSPARQEHQHQRHRRECRRDQSLEIAQRDLHEGLVENHHAGQAHVDAGETLANPVGELVGELGYPGPFAHLVLARQRHGDVDAADPAVARDQVPRQAPVRPGRWHESGIALSASPSAAPSTRSRTRMSSSSAVKCWKLVSESTRVA